MRQRLGQFFLLAICGSVTWASVALGEPLWKQLTPRPRVESDPEADYGLTESDGPWLIMAATFSGEGGETQARDLALELRSDNNLSAYVHKITFDLAKDAPMRGLDRYGRMHRAKYRGGDSVTEVAVLIGDFVTVDDPEAQKTLKKIKMLKPKTLSGDWAGRSNLGYASWRAQRNQLKGLNQGPMGHAFLTRNPVLPEEYFVPRGVDTFIAKMNRGVKYSLLDCPGRYTVKVATYRGKSSIKGTARTNTNGTKSTNSTDSLVVAAENAHLLTVFLRAKGWDEASGFAAYEFHDRNESIVTIGSFDKAFTKRPDGRKVPLQDVHTIIRTFGAMYETPITDPRVMDIKRKGEEVKQQFSNKFSQRNGQIANGYHPKALYLREEGVTLPFDIHPSVVDVPRSSISSAYVRE